MERRVINESQGVVNRLARPNRSMPKRATFLLIVLLTSSAVLPSRAAAGIEIECQATIDSWKLSHPALAGRCHCERSDQMPVCDEGSGTTGGRPASNAKRSNDFAAMIGQQVIQSFIEGLFKGPADTGFTLPPPPAKVVNPRYAQASQELQQRRLPPEQAKYILAEALRSQQQAVAPYRAGNALQQLTLSRCLGMRAVGQLNSGEWEEPSWLLRQSAQAANGDLVEVDMGSCPPPPPVSESSAQGSLTDPPGSVKKLEELVALVETKRETWDHAKEEVKKAQEQVSQWKETRARLESEGAAATTEGATEKRPDDDAIAEALRMQEQAEQQLKEAQSLEASCDQDYQATQDLTRKMAAAQREGTP